MKTNWLAEFFNRQREVIEAAETPFAKLAIFVLPVMAPLVPAFMTGLHMFRLLIELFTFQYANEISGFMSIVIGITLELLGYIGAILFIQSLFQWIKTRKTEYILPFTLNGLAYMFYLVAMWLINFQLGKYFGTPEIVNNIFGLLSFITVPTGLLAANHLSQKELKEDEKEMREEKRKERLEKLKIKHGYHEEPKVYQQDIERVEQKKASEYKDKIWKYLDEQYQKHKHVARVVEVTSKFNLPYDKAKGFVSSQRKMWMEQNGISETQNA